MCLLIVAIEAIVVLGLLDQGGHAILGGDGPEYDRLGRNLAEHGTFSNSVAPPYEPSVVRGPGYPALLAVLKLGGLGSPLALRIVQFLMLAVLAWFVALIAREIAGPRPVFLAAVLGATYLPLVWLSSYHLSEIAASLTATITVYLLLRAQRERTSNALWLAAGAALALTTYVRPSFLLLVALVAAFVVLGCRARPARGRWMPATLVVAAFACALLPWTLRSSTSADSFVPVAAAAGVSLYASAQQYSGEISYKFTVDDWGAFKRASHGIEASAGNVEGGAKHEVAVDRAYRDAASKVRRQLSIGDFIKDLPVREAFLWGTADYPPPRAAAVLHRAAQIQYLVLVVLMGAGFAILRSRLFQLWPVWVIPAYLSLVHLVFHVEARYTLPARPALIAIAAIAATAALSRLRADSGRPWA